MDCSSIQEKLSAYMEGILPPEERILIDDHLKTFQKCNEVFADLKKTVEYVSNLEKVEPPPWLTQKIITRVRKEVQPKKGIIHLLFHPLHIKLPIEAVAAIVIAVTVIYVFKTIQTEVRLSKVPSEEITTFIPSGEKEKITALSESKEKQLVPSKKPEIMDKASKAPQAAAPVFREAETPLETRPSGEVIAKDESKVEILSRIAKAKALSERKEELINFFIHVKDIKTASEEIEKALMKLNVKIIKKEFFADRYVIIAELDSKKLNELSGKLKHIGEVEEKTVSFEALPDKVEICIEILENQCSLQDPSCP